MHGLLLGQWSGRKGAAPAQPAPASLQVRTLQAAGAPTAMASLDARRGAQAEPATDRLTDLDSVPAETSAPVRPAARLPTQTEAAAITVRADTARPPAPAALDATVVPDLSARPGDAQDAQPLPAYATRPPPAASLHYLVRRGEQVGNAVLDWRPEGERYGLTLRGLPGALSAPGSFSQGGFDAAGLAPDRFVDRRRGRDLRAANFRRERGEISFSGPPAVLELQPGTQDRLSWLLQLPAIFEANPEFAQPGAQVALRVVGTRGAADIWTFTVLGHETIDAAGGARIDTLHLVREASRPYELQVKLWLDPARHHLPVRVQLWPRPAPQATEYLLERLTLQ